MKPKVVFQIDIKRILQNNSLIDSDVLFCKKISISSCNSEIR